MASEWQETALSEVIGFILILAIITAAASLYIVYVVPAQGREAEIRHMEYISGEFTGYKIGIDSLWINNREDVTLSRTFDLGTLGATTQGTFLNLPLFQPYGSGGTMVVNGRGDTIGYEVDALVEGFPGDYEPSDPSYIGEPRHLYINIKTSDVSTSEGVLITPSVGSNWYAWLNVTKMITPAGSGTIDPPLVKFSGQGADKIIEYLEGVFYNWAKDVEGSSVISEPALTITVVKNGKTTLTNWTIYENIDDNVNYTVDILDYAYGLNEDLSYPFTITPSILPSMTHIQYYYPVQFGYKKDPDLKIGPNPMGSLEYRSNNYYWIQQNYYYQNGAVFLEQPDDGSVVKTMPSITLTNLAGILKVQVTDIVITPPSQSLGGTGSAEVTSFVYNVTEGVTEDGSRFATGIPNAKQVVITVEAKDEQSALAWEGAFRQVRTLGIQRNDVPDDGWIDTPTRTGNTVTFQIKGNDPDEYDILLDYTRVNMSASLQSVAA
jgi:hypothetical protein